MINPKPAVDAAGAGGNWTGAHFSPSNSVPSADEQAMQDWVFVRLNAERAAIGRAPLTLSANMTGEIRAWQAYDVADLSFQHIPSAYYIWRKRLSLP